MPTAKSIAIEMESVAAKGDASILPLGSLGNEGTVQDQIWICTSLIVPSMFVVHKYLDCVGIAAYVVGSALVVRFAPRLEARLSVRFVAWIASSICVVVLLAFVAVYPAANRHESATGSDQDDALNLGALALVRGESPYLQKTYLGNALSPLPGAFVLALPFVLVGTSALQNLMWLPLFFLVVRKEANDERVAPVLALLVLIASPAVSHQIVTGGDYVANTIYVLIGLWWCARTTRHHGTTAVVWGLTLASRANFILLIPLLASWLHQRHGWRVALTSTLLSCSTVAALSVPFYLNDPAGFGPLHAYDRVSRFDALRPGLGVVVLAAMAVLAIALCLTRTTAANLFRNCAIVQAFPVVVGTVLSTAFGAGAALEYAVHGTFFAWFAFMALMMQRNPGPGAVQR